jgi:hypothetical protein
MVTEAVGIPFDSLLSMAEKPYLQERQNKKGMDASFQLLRPSLFRQERSTAVNSQ